MPYHVRITPKSDRTEDEVRLDLTREQLEDRFLKPYKEGKSIIIGGKTIPPDDIERIRINLTTESADELIPVIQEERRRSPIATSISDEWYVTTKGKDVTDDLITGPPGSGISQRFSSEGPDVQGPRAVFVIHGRNGKLRDSMFTFLRAIGLHPLEWSEAVSATGKASPYIGEILDAAFSIARAVVVLMTPDDEAQLREMFRGKNEPQHETQLTGQARLNVIFEAGMAIGRFEDRTVMVEIGNLRPFSDVAGRHVIRLDNSTQRRQDLARRLESAGCPINLNGTDWHTVGDFTV